MMRMTASIAPMTMPAIAPLLRPPDAELALLLVVVPVTALVLPPPSVTADTVLVTEVEEVGEVLLLGLAVSVVEEEVRAAAVAVVEDEDEAAAEPV